MIVDDRDDFVTLLVFIPREPNAIPPFLATVLVPSPWSTLRSSCFSAARCRTLATNARQSDPSSAHLAVGKVMAHCLDLSIFGMFPQPPRLEPCLRLLPHTAQHFQISLGLCSVANGAEYL
jgi:hypothetical protein